MKQVSKDKANRRLAIIDIGSNTFHLVIVSLSSKSYELLHRERRFVYLAKDGIDYLSEETIQRGTDNLQELLVICLEYDVQVIKAIGTAALRSASNAQAFTRQVSSRFNIDIEIISGKREAELIHKGVALSGIKMIRPSVIVDIGGGSVEFIIVSNGIIRFYDSYNVGVSQLRHQFMHEDPLSDERNKLIYSHLDEVIAGFIDEANSLKVEVIIGASGPFEIIESMCQVDASKQEVTTKDTISNMIERVIYLPLEERQKLSLMPESRADLSVESLLLIKYLFVKIDSLIGGVISPYALKEGVISEMI